MAAYGGPPPQVVSGQWVQPVGAPKQQPSMSRSDLVPPPVPESAVSFFLNEKQTTRVYESAWKHAYDKMGPLAEDEIVEYQQMRCQPNSVPEGYWWRAVIATNRRMIVVEGNNAEICQCTAWGGMFNSCRKLCGIDMLLNVALNNYRWSEFVAVSLATFSGPGRFPCQRAIPANCLGMDCRESYKAGCFEGLFCWMSWCPCCFKYRDKLPPCCRLCPTITETTHARIALNSEGFSYNPFYDTFAPFGGGIFKTFKVQELTMGHDEASELMTVVNRMTSENKSKDK